MGYMPQQVISHQATSRKTGRAFSVVGRLLSSWRSRIYSNIAEMQLFLNSNVERISYIVPSISSKRIRKHLPKSCTARDDGLAAAENFPDPIGVKNDVDDGCRGHRSYHVVRCSGW